MLACKIHAKEDLRIEQEETPDIQPGEVLLKLGAGGICGSDLHYYFEGRNGSFVVREPLIPGHEASAVVARVGAGVTRVKVGDKVAVSPSHACGRCDYCRDGREQLCRNMKFLGSASLFPHIQGMFREYFVMGERQCYPVGGDISLGELAFAEPLAVGLHAVNRGGELLGKSVLITGAGTIGCVTVQRGATRRRAHGHGVGHPGPSARASEAGRRRRRAARATRRRGARETAVRRRVRSVGQHPSAQDLHGGGQARRRRRAGRHAAARAVAVRRQRR